MSNKKYLRRLFKMIMMAVILAYSGQALACAGKASVPPVEEGQPQTGQDGTSE